MNLTPKEIAQFAEDCASNFLSRATAQHALLKIGINSSLIEDSPDDRAYYTNVIQYLLQRDEMENWFIELSKEKIVFIKQWLKKIKYRIRKEKMMHTHPNSSYYLPKEDNEHSTGEVITTRKTETIEIELKIDRDFKSFTYKDREDVLQAIKKLLNVSRKLTIISEEPGSVILKLKLTHAESQCLEKLLKEGRLKEYDIVDVRIIKQNSSDEWLDEQQGTARSEASPDTVEIYDDVSVSSPRATFPNTEWQIVTSSALESVGEEAHKALQNIMVNLQKPITHYFLKRLQLYGSGQDKFCKQEAEEMFATWQYKIIQDPKKIFSIAQESKSKGNLRFFFYAIARRFANHYLKEKSRHFEQAMDMDQYNEVEHASQMDMDQYDEVEHANQIVNNALLIMKELYQEQYKLLKYRYFNEPPMSIKEIAIHQNLVSSENQNEMKKVEITIGKRLSRARKLFGSLIEAEIRKTLDLDSDAQKRQEQIEEKMNIIRNYIGKIKMDISINP